MAIKLRVISDHYRELGENRSRVFGVNGGTVGRAPGNDWILPDPRRVVSGHPLACTRWGPVTSETTTAAVR